MAWDADHFSGNPRFPAHAQSHPAAAYEVGKKGGAVYIKELLFALHTEHPGHFQKLWIGTHKSCNGIYVNDGEYHKKGNKNG